MRKILESILLSTSETLNNTLNDFLAAVQLFYSFKEAALNIAVNITFPFLTLTHLKHLKEYNASACTSCNFNLQLCVG